MHSHFRRSVRLWHVRWCTTVYVWRRSPWLCMKDWTHQDGVHTKCIVAAYLVLIKSRGMCKACVWGGVSQHLWTTMCVRAHGQCKGNVLDAVLMTGLWPKFRLTRTVWVPVKIIPKETGLSKVVQEEDLSRYFVSRNKNFQRRDGELMKPVTTTGVP